MALLTIRQVAAELSVSRPTVYQLTSRGALRAIRVGRAMRVEEAAVAAFIAAGGWRRPAGGVEVAACLDRAAK